MPAGPTTKEFWTTVVNDLTDTQLDHIAGILEDHCANCIAGPPWCSYFSYVYDEEEDEPAPETEDDYDAKRRERRYDAYPGDKGY